LPAVRSDYRLGPVNAVQHGSRIWAIPTLPNLGVGRQGVGDFLPGLTSLING
jgi:hypothetical protein